MMDGSGNDCIVIVLCQWDTAVDGHEYTTYPTAYDATQGRITEISLIWTVLEILHCLLILGVRRTSIG